MKHEQDAATLRTKMQNPNGAYRTKAEESRWERQKQMKAGMKAGIL